MSTCPIGGPFVLWTAQFLAINPQAFPQKLLASGLNSLPLGTFPIFKQALVFSVESSLIFHFSSMDTRNNASGFQDLELLSMILGTGKIQAEQRAPHLLFSILSSRWGAFYCLMPTGAFFLALYYPGAEKIDDWRRNYNKNQQRIVDITTLCRFFKQTLVPEGICVLPKMCSQSRGQAWAGPIRCSSWLQRSGWTATAWEPKENNLWCSLGPAWW